MNIAENWQDRASKLSFRNKLFINNEYVEAASGETFPCVSPIDGRELVHVAKGGAEDINRAVMAARTAFENGKWSNLAPAKRKQVMIRFADLIANHADELALLETLDMGKPVTFARKGDLPGVVRTVQWFGECIDKVYGEIAPLSADEVGLITREPLGVIGAVVPWNFPLLMAAWKFAPLIASRNSWVLKPAEQSPLSALRVAELAAEAGLPPGVFNVVSGFGETAGQALGRHQDVDAIAFTGSTEVGKLFLKYSSESNMKAVSLECGGKTPNIVFPDVVDMDRAARESAFGIFFNSGQVCVAASRLLVHESVKDAFLEKIQAAAAAMSPGDPLVPDTQLGPVVDAGQLDRILSYIDQGKNEGAKLVAGGNQVKRETGGFYVEPTVFDQVANNMTIAREEIFGPVLSVLTFRNIQDAISIANDSIFGLQANIWTGSLNTAHRVARELKAGTVNVNNTDGPDITMPFGGYKQSGFGRDKSLHALEKFTQLKSTYITLQ